MTLIDAGIIAVTFWILASMIRFSVLAWMPEDSLTARFFRMTNSS